MRSVIDQLISGLISETVVRGDNDSDVVYVTELIGCPMKYYLRRRYPSLGLQLMFNEKVLLGKIIHEGIESLLDRVVSDVTVEVPVEAEIDGVRVAGRADIVTPDSVIELKTTRSLNHLPREQHILQAGIYARLLDRDRAVLLYIVLNNDTRLVEYEIDPVDEKTLKELVQGIKEKSPAPRFDWECNYCPFKAVCPIAR